MRDDVIVRYIDLPTRVNAVTLPDCDGYYNVYINACLSCEAQKEAYEHELYHIEHGHIYNYEPVANCEAETKDFVKGRRGYRK